MSDQHDGLFNEKISSTYDDDPEMFSPEVVDPAVDFLVNFAALGNALEFGIGTGRIALPLSGLGVSVHGIDISRPMLAKLAAKPGGLDIGVTVGDFATTFVANRFSVVYLVYNTIMNLTSQAEQVACFRNAANHLNPGGHFVIEVMVPELQKLPAGDTIRVFDMSENHIGIDEYDTVNQGLVSHHHKMVDGRAERFSVPMRYVWPNELDLMAQMAGMSLAERWGGWLKEPFTNVSTRHISVWEKPSG